MQSFCALSVKLKRSNFWKRNSFPSFLLSLEANSAASLFFRECRRRKLWKRGSAMYLKWSRLVSYEIMVRRIIGSTCGNQCDRNEAHVRQEGPYQSPTSKIRLWSNVHQGDTKAWRESLGYLIFCSEWGFPHLFGNLYNSALLANRCSSNLIQRLQSFEIDLIISRRCVALVLSFFSK